MRYLSNHFWSLLTQATSSAGNFIVTIVLARRVGAEGFSTWAIVWLIVYGAASFHQATVLYPVSVLGVRRDGSVSDTRLGSIGLVHLAYLGIATPLCFALLAVGLPGPGPLVALLATALLLPGYCTFELCKRVLFLRGRGLVGFVTELGRQAIALAWLAAFIAYEVDDVLWLSAWAGASSFAVALACALGLRLKARRGHTFPLVARSWSFSSGLAAHSLFQRLGVDVVWALLGVLAGGVGLGIARAQQQLLNLTGPLNLAFQATLIPEFGRAYRRHGVPALRVRLHGWLLPFALFAATLLGGAFVLGDQVARAVLGAEFARIPHILTILSLATAAQLLAIPAFCALTAMQRSRPQYLAAALGAAIALALVYPLTTTFGLIGGVTAYALGPVAESLVIIGAALLASAPGKSERCA